MFMASSNVKPLNLFSEFAPNINMGRHIGGHTFYGNYAIKKSVNRVLTAFTQSTWVQIVLVKTRKMYLLGILRYRT